MSIISPADLEASPLADLHALASALGIDGFRRLRKDDCRRDPRAPGRQRRRAARAPAAAPRADAAAPAEAEAAAEDEADEPTRTSRGAPRPLEPLAPPPPLARGRRGGRGGEERRARAAAGGARRGARRGGGASRASAPRGAGARGEREPAGERIAEGVVELLANGSGFLRVSADEASDDDVYISAAQARRCELVAGDRISGPVRAGAALRAPPVAGPHRHDQRRRRPRRRSSARASTTSRSTSRA